MNTKALVFALTAVCLTSGAAFAQSYDYRNDGHERGVQYQRGAHSDPYDRDGNGVDDRVQRDYRNDGERSHNNDRDSYSRHRDSYPQTQVYGNRGYNNSYNNGYNNSYNNGYNSGYNTSYNNGDRRDNNYGNAGRYQARRGEYLPSQYRDRRYVVTDWRSRNLYQPQYGYQWVQSGNNDYAMVAIATGLIAAVLLNH